MRQGAALSLLAFALAALLAGCAPAPESAPEASTDASAPASAVDAVPTAEGAPDAPIAAAASVAIPAPALAPLTAPAAENPAIRVDSPLPGQVVTSPLLVRGVARGPWFFEGSFGLWLVDAQGNKLAEGVAEATGDWMTTDFAPFEATLNFKLPADGGVGQLMLEADDPEGTGDPNFQLQLPVRFDSPGKAPLSP